jgi:hypothetical protein
MAGAFRPRTHLAPRCWRFCATHCPAQAFEVFILPLSRLFFGQARVHGNHCRHRHRSRQAGPCSHPGGLASRGRRSPSAVALRLHCTSGHRMGNGPATPTQPIAQNANCASESAVPQTDRRLPPPGAGQAITCEVLNSAKEGAPAVLIEQLRVAAKRCCGVQQTLRSPPKVKTTFSEPVGHWEPARQKASQAPSPIDQRGRSRALQARPRSR